MKKVLKSLALTGMVLGLAASVQAADTVQLTLSNPTVTGISGACEKIGAVTFDIDAATILQEGDWFYMDLGSSATFCKALDYMVVGDAGAGTAADFVGWDSAGLTDLVDADNIILGGAALAIDDDFDGAGSMNNIAAGATDTKGPFSATVDAAGAATDALTPANHGVVLHVTAAANSNRLLVTVLGVDAGPGEGDTDSVTVADNVTFSLTIGDGLAHTTEILLDTVTDYTAAAGATTNLEEWGSDTDDTIDATDAVPHVENSFCAANITGDLYTDFASLNDFLTFTGDSKIAHTASVTMALETCDKEDLYIEIGDQNQCEFDYSGNGSGYCGTFAGSKVYIQAASTIGDSGDSFDITVTSDTSGVYFSAPVSVTGYKITETPCNDTGTTAVVATDMMENVGSTSDAAWPNNTCAVEAKRRIDKVYTEGGDLTGIHNFDALEIVLPDMYYDTSIIDDSVEADVTITLDKYPCGTMFTESYTVGTFMTTCPTTTTSGTTMLYPFLPPMDGSATGWWGGLTVVNGSTTAGTCTLTYTESDGDTGTYTTASIAAASQVNGPALSAITAGTSNTGTFGDDNVAIKAVCTFSLGGGFAFTGNSTEGTGYTAYVSGGWQ